MHRVVRKLGAAAAEARKFARTDHSHVLWEGQKKTTVKNLGWMDERFWRGKVTCWKLETTGGPVDLEVMELLSSTTSILLVAFWTLPQSQAGFWATCQQVGANQWTIYPWVRVRTVTFQAFWWLSYVHVVFHTSYPSLYLLTLTVLQHWILIYFLNRDIIYIDYVYLWYDCIYN